jgi:hypothetical protein
MDECCAPPPYQLGRLKKQDAGYCRVLWAVLSINAVMFAVDPTGKSVFAVQRLREKYSA